MTWTVTQRIAAGFAAILGLVALLVVLGIVALRGVEANYREALKQEQTVLEPALMVESQTREATIEYQRFLMTGDERFARARDTAVVVSRGLLEDLRRAAPASGGSGGWAEVASLLDRWNEGSLRSMDAVRAGRPDEGVRVWGSDVLPLRLQLRGAIDREVERARERSTAAVEDAVETAASMQRVLVLGGVLTLLLGIAAALLLNRAVSGPLRETTGVLASNAAEILAATTQQASSASQTSAAVVETSTTVDEVTQTAEQSTERARAVADSAQRTAEIGQRGRRAVQESVSAMAGVQEQVESIADSILTLAEQAQAIGEIIASVNDIAEQTNLLALNAAVEAARAGEQGRGFAVVAGEIRNLADQSKRSTVQVRQILGEIQRATSAAVMTTERGSQQVKAGAAQVNQAGETIATLAEAATEAAHAAAQIVASAGQQAAGMAQIRQAMGNIHDATQQNLSSTRQAEQAAQDLNHLGSRLLDLVGRDGRSAASRRARA